LLPVYQSAYRSHHSSETQLLKVVSELLDAADADPPRVSLLGILDPSAAFDTVDHDILIARLQESYGIRGTALSWLASFLDARSQVVVYSGQTSAPH